MTDSMIRAKMTCRSTNKAKGVFGGKFIMASLREGRGEWRKQWILP